MLMMEFRLFHWFVALVLVTTAIPFGKILSRTGHNPAWCLLSLVPFANLIALWVFAFKPWPRDNKPQQT